MSPQPSGWAFDPSGSPGGAVTAFVAATEAASFERWSGETPGGFRGAAPHASEQIPRRVSLSSAEAIS